jgi:hypothetical protein
MSAPFCVVRAAGDHQMRPIANPEFDPAKPVQTRKGAAQALRCSHNRIDALIREGKLKTVTGLGRIVRITTRSILAVAHGEVVS